MTTGSFTGVGIDIDEIDTFCLHFPCSGPSWLKKADRQERQQDQPGKQGGAGMPVYRISYD
jgi:hypothetical protein